MIISAKSYYTAIYRNRSKPNKRVIVSNIVVKGFNTVEILRVCICDIVFITYPR